MKDPIWNLTPEQAKPYKETMRLFKENKLKFVGFPYTAEGIGQSLHKMRTQRQLKQDAIRRSLFRRHATRTIEWIEKHGVITITMCDKARSDEVESQTQKAIMKL